MRGKSQKNKEMKKDGTSIPDTQSSRAPSRIFPLHHRAGCRDRGPRGRGRGRGLRGRGQRSPRVEVEASGLEVEVEVTGVEAEIEEGRFIHPYQVRGQRPPGRRFGANGPQGEKNLPVAIQAQHFVNAQPRAMLAAVLPQGIPPRMRCATWNVDLPQSYFVEGRRQHHAAIVDILHQVDLLALQEVGGWDIPLDKEPSRRSTVGRSGP